MLSLARIRLLGASLFLLWSLPASAQIGETVFDPNGDTVTAALSGTDCGLDRCTDYEWLLTASAGTLHQHFATLEFGFVNREPCAVSAPPPGSRVHSRQRSDCPGGTIAIYERLDTSTLSGPDYGLKRLRMCTDDGYGL
ncbi:MAG: hypothetical protein HKN04_10360, partial [Rhodothermaceae bacterium]|nr:hypothetical protein [Rhodothermaceae bacterium]